MPRPRSTPSQHRPDADDIPALLRGQSSEPPGGRRSRNPGGYQESALSQDDNAEQDREAADNCALLHRATEENPEHVGESAAEDSPARRRTSR